MYWKYFANLPLRAVRKGWRLSERVGRDIKVVWGRLFGSPYMEQEFDLVIFDDLYPSPLTQFRVLEFEKYFDRWHDVAAFSTALEYDKYLNQYSALYPRHVAKIHKFEYKAVKAKAAYFLFLHNARTFLRFIELNRIPFVFTLYPGGGLWLDHPASDKTLRRIFRSPYFHKVIVTQKITRDYLLRRNFCSEDRIVKVVGTPYKLENKFPRIENRRNFDVAFCAVKYTPYGVDKGYDLFIETCKLLKNEIKNLHVHVIGDFDTTDIDVTDLDGCITFYGLQPMNNLRKIFSGIDVILSPNRANVLAKGAFDGFPTGAVAIAGMEGAAMFVTDPLDQNEYYSVGTHVELIDHNPTNIASKVIQYYKNPEKLSKLQNQGRDRILELVADEVQMPPRYDVLEELINNQC